MELLYLEWAWRIEGRHCKGRKRGWGCGWNVKKTDELKKELLFCLHATHKCFLNTLHSNLCHLSEWPKLRLKISFFERGEVSEFTYLYIYASFQLPSFIFHPAILLLWGYSTPFVKRSFGSTILVDYLFVFIYIAFNCTIKCIWISVLFLKS